MSISSRAVAMIVPRPLKPQREVFAKLPKRPQIRNPSRPTVFGHGRTMDGYFWPEPRGMNAWLDKHMWVFWTVMAGCLISAAWIVFGLVVGG